MDRMGTGFGRRVMLVALLVLGTSGSATAGGLGRYASDEPLSAERAFPMSVMTGRDGNVLVTWEMPPGYYLYQDKIQFAARGGLTIKRVVVPTGLLKNDPFLGSVRIYRDLVTVIVSPTAKGQSGELLVKFQGCLEEKVCYPPMQRVFQVGAAHQG